MKTDTKNSKNAKALKTKRGATREHASRTGIINWQLLIKRLAVVVCVSLLSVGTHTYWPNIVASVDRPVAAVTVEGSFRYVTKEEVSTLIQSQLEQSYFNLDLEQLQEAIEAQPWIQTAAITRQWPYGLKVVVEEQVPIAQWRDNAFVNRRGEIFTGRTDVYSGYLPRLDGPDKHSVQLMVQYQQLTNMLRPVNLEVTGLSCDEKLAWQARLSNGVLIYIGRDKVAEKIKRFLEVFEGPLNKTLADIQVVDIRYDNGVAIRWKAGAAVTDVASRL